MQEGKKQRNRKQRGKKSDVLLSICNCTKKKKDFFFEPLLKLYAFKKGKKNREGKRTCRFLCRVCVCVCVCACACVCAVYSPTLTPTHTPTPTHTQTPAHAHTFIDGQAETKYSELKCFEGKPNNPDQCSHCFKVL
jgi:hypothetical protein